MAVTCVVGAAQAWLPFSDPIVDEAPLLELFQSRITGIQQHEAADIAPPGVTSFERHPHHLLRILRRCNYNVEQSVLQWCAWVRWRQEQRIDEITDEVIRCDLEANLIKWQGQDKKGRLCCVVTGRHMDPDGRRNKGGTGLSFQKYLIRSVEDGCRRAMEQSCASNTSIAGSSSSISASSSDRSRPPAQHQIDRQEDDAAATSSPLDAVPDVRPGPGADASPGPGPGLDAGPDFCIVYDRRGLDWQHIDPMLYKLSRTTIDDLRVCPTIII